MSFDLTRLRKAVADDKSVNASAITFINGLKDQLRTLAADLSAERTSAADAATELTAMADQFDAQQAELAAAFTENTPTPPGPTV